MIENDAHFSANMSGGSGFNAGLFGSTGDRFDISGSSGKIQDYAQLVNKPLIEGTVLVGDRSFEELGLDFASYEDISKLFR